MKLGRRNEKNRRRSKQVFRRDFYRNKKGAESFIKLSAPFLFADYSAYQISQMSLRTILLPCLQPKALANSCMFESGPLTR